MAIEKPMKIGIIGLGFGATEFIPSLEAQPEIEIYAGADLRPQALDEFEKRYGGKTYRTAEALCADPNVEAVWISTPNLRMLLLRLTRASTSTSVSPWA